MIARCAVSLTVSFDFDCLVRFSLLCFRNIVSTSSLMFYSLSLQRTSVAPELDVHLILHLLPQQRIHLNTFYSCFSARCKLASARRCGSGLLVQFDVSSTIVFHCNLRRSSVACQPPASSVLSVFHHPAIRTHFSFPAYAIPIHTTRVSSDVTVSLVSFLIAHVPRRSPAFRLLQGEY